MDKTIQARKAAQLKSLHGGGKILVLPNAWDVASARLIEEIGFPAVATTSAGVAASLGYPDGQRVSRDEMLEVVARVARGVDLPVSADLEAGYGTTPGDMAETARALVDAGGVGLNLEDAAGAEESSLVDLGPQTEKIRALREAAASAGVPLVINARTDIYLIPIGPRRPASSGPSSGFAPTPARGPIAYSRRRSRTPRPSPGWCVPWKPP